jgi:DNA (cytosine-5)-methyltransferase 1
MAGYEVIAGADIEPSYICTFEHNFPNATTIKTDLSTKRPAELMEELGIARGELDFLTGGPPCQGFSKNVPREQRHAESQNNQLIRTYLEYCDALRPRLILIENVAEMKNGFEQAYSREIQVRLSRLGYTVREAVLNSADFGVPQRRRRAFFLASRDSDAINFPRPSHRRPSEDDQPSLLEDNRHVTVWDAIGDLPSLSHGEGQGPCEYSCSAFSDFQRAVRNKTGRVMNHVARKLAPIQYERLSSIGPGQGIKDLPDHLRPNSGYSGAYGRLTKDMVAPTITRWVFHPGSGRYGHPVDVRTITMREAARLQGFPDWYEFCGTYNDQAGQIGNAVPPLLVKAIATSLLGTL